MQKLLLIFVGLCLLSACGSGEDSPEMQTESPEANPSANSTAMAVENPEMTVRDLDLRTVEQLSKGETHTIAVNDTLSFTFQVQARNVYVKGIRSLSGTLMGNESGVVTLSIQQDTLNGTILIPGKDWYWAIYLDRNSGKHMVRRKAQDQLEGSAPLVPEN